MYIIYTFPIQCINMFEFEREAQELQFYIELSICLCFKFNCVQV